MTHAVGGSKLLLVVVGASAGGLDPLEDIVASLPTTFPAAVCVVLHLPAYIKSHLPERLRRRSRLPVEFASDGEAILPGRVYVAPRDRHLMIRNGSFRLTRGPKEHRARPAVDPLFRSAALYHGPRVIGVVLSGALDDGTPGLWTIKDRGGLAVVQAPEEAAVGGMPASAIANVAVDHVVASGEMGPLLARLVAGLEQVGHPPGSRAQGDDLRREVAIAGLDEEAHADSARYGRPSRFACPDCGGVLWRTDRSGPFAFRCEVGHAFGAISLAKAQAEGSERALWAALQALEDQAALGRLRAESARQTGAGEALVAELTAQVEAAEEYAAAVRAVLRLGGGDGEAPVPGEGG